MATTYGQFCPVAMASEVLTERWTPLVVRELLCGSTRFNDLRRGVPLMSPALLSKRLKTLERVGVVMEPLPGEPLEAEGVLNPGSGRGPDGELYLLPRMVAAGNVSRIGLARVLVEDGVPVGVERQGVVLAPDRGFERAIEQMVRTGKARMSTVHRGRGNTGEP